MRQGPMEQNGYYGLDFFGNNAAGHSAGGPTATNPSNRMNGETPSGVPITTLAGIASLTDLLPELPVPGPSPNGNPYPGSNLLYHSSLVEEATQYLTNPSEHLVSQVSTLLANTSVDYIELSDKNGSVTNNTAGGHPVPPNNLANLVYRVNPGLFDGNSRHHRQQQQQQHPWPQDTTRSSEFNNQVNNTFFPNNSQATPPLVPNNNSVSSNNNGTSFGGMSSSAQTTPQSDHERPSNFDPQQQQQQHHALLSEVHETPPPAVVAVPEPKKEEVESEVKPPVGQNNGQVIMPSILSKKLGSESSGLKREGVMEPKIMLNKLSKDAEELMRQSVLAYNKQNKDKTKSEEMGVYNNTPRSSKAKRSKYNEDEEDEDESSSSDSESEGRNKKSRNKFFKATEKERDEEKKKVKEERRKRKMEDGGDGGPDANFEPESFGKRRRKDATPERPDSPKPFVPKKVTRKVERSLVPMLPKINIEEFMDEDNTFKRFNKTVELIFDNMDDINMQDFENLDDGAEIPQEILIQKYHLSELAAETAKLRSLGVMESISADRLLKLLNILELNIRDGSKVIPLPTDDEDESDDRLWLELAMERVMRAADASLTVLNIMTSKNMSKRVYIDDVIDRVSLFLRFQLTNTIYPSYDPVYKEISRSKTGYCGSMKKKRSYAHGVRDKNVLALYNKVHELTSMLASLVKMQLLTDTTILYISTLGVAPFFVENIPELQLAALKLVTNLFGKYEKHRKLLLDDILASIARLPSSKRSLRTYRLNASTHIQMLTALVLQLIQCVVILPRKLAFKDQGKQPTKKDKEIIEIEAENECDDRDVLIDNKYNMAMATAHQFLTVFLKKCGSKNEDIDYRPLFENFVQDLLTTVNTPEWPAAELLLSLLGRVLCEKFKDRSTEMPLRISSLEYLGVVAARLRKDAVQSKMKVDYIDSIISLIKEEEEKEKTPEVELDDDTNKKKKKKTKEEKLEDIEEERDKFLQRVLLDYLAVNGGEDDQAAMNARHFYICQWFRDVNAMGRKPKKRKSDKKSQQTKKKSRRNSTSDEEESSDEEEESEEGENMSDAKKNELYEVKEMRKDLLMKKIPPFGISRGKKAQVLSTHIDQDSAHLIVRYLSSKRPFFNSFNFYLQDILKVLTEQSTHIRTKALKCMTMIVTEDPEVLLRQDMRNAVQYSFIDNSTMVREAAVDLVGKFILHKQDLITQYYTIITERILDTGVSVRKRVIKILKDICIEYPNYKKIPEICVKMIRRINDEEGIRKLVMEVFQNLWFVPIKERNRSQNDDELLVTRARNITDVVISAGRDTEWFEQLLQTLFKPREDKEDATKKHTEPPAQLVLACQQIVDCLVESVLQIEETSIRNSNNQSEMEGGQRKTMGSSNRIVACLTTLYLFAKNRPQLLVGHVQTLQPYLQVQCRTQGDYQIISNVARTLELSVPLIKHPSEIFLAQLEEDAVKLILLHDKKVIAACVSCLGSVVNRVTKNFGLIRDCFNKYYGQMSRYRTFHEDNPEDKRLMEMSNIKVFRRALFTVSLLLRHFDFCSEEVYLGLQSGSDTVEEAFETIFYFMRHESADIQSDTLQALGFVCIRHYKFMLESKLKSLYIDIITEDFYSVQHKIKVLNNLESYLSEEEIRMRQLDEHWEEHASKENLKEMGDVSSGMASTVIQVYLKAVLNSFINSNMAARHSALKVIQLILAQGLVHPVQIVPYLICMSTDSATVISHTADRELQEIEKKYPGFIHMKLLQGIRLSFNLQEIVQGSGGVVRGCRTAKEGEIPTALNGFLYSIMKSTKAQRRAILTSLLKQFDDSAKSSLSMMLYLADNLAYIPFTVLDEPLFVIHQIDIMISVSGSNLLQAFKESLRPPPSAEERLNLETGKTDYIYDEDLDDEFDSVLSRLPEDCKTLQASITASQGCMLLLVLKEHLKDFYGLTTTRIQQYSPTDTSKAFDRQVNRKPNVRFNPKATISIIQKGVKPSEYLSDEEKQSLVKKYLEFKELMNRIDPDDEEDAEGDTPVKNVMPGYHSQSNNTPIKNNSTSFSNTPVKQTRGNNASSSDTGSGAVPKGYQQHSNSGRQQQHQQNPVVQNSPMMQPQIRLKPLMPQLTRKAAATAPPSTQTPSQDQNYESMEGMELDPETGMMVPLQTGEDEEEEYEDDDDDIKIIGQSSNSRRDSNHQSASSRVPKVTINLKNKEKDKKRDKKHKKHKKKKRYLSDEEEAEDESDPDFTG